MGLRIHPLVVMLALGGCGRSSILVAADNDDDMCSADGESVFARVVLGYDPIAGGGAVPELSDVMEPRAALGPPELATPPLGAVSLGDGGTLTVGFAPCVITSDGSPGGDVIIYEQGYAERVTIALLPTTRAVTWLGEAVGDDGWVAIDAYPDSDDAIDLDAELGALPREALRFEAIRLRDVPGQGEVTPDTPGADIDAIEAPEGRLADPM
ncbi:MAG: hypothetical protein IAG13_09815 [Deltaproteobacteria bacterium]|nr:hypothetical protein [Nannocystaceae bacterium]